MSSNFVILLFSLSDGMTLLKEEIPTFLFVPCLYLIISGFRDTPTSRSDGLDNIGKKGPLAAYCLLFNKP